MARINIEECWWSDPRRMKLIELAGTLGADGVAINAWRIAQEFWAKGELVPLSIWKHVQANDKLIQANLAEERDGGIYVRGSSQYLEWVAERRRAAAAGGKKSAKKRAKKPQTPQANGKQTQANVNQTQPSGSYSSSGSDSSSDSEVENSSNSKPQAFIAGYCTRFKVRYGNNPEILGKDAGIAGRLVKGWSQSKIDLYLDAFFSMPDSWLVKTKHPLAAFETKLNEVVVFAKSGDFTTMKQAQQADVAVTISDQLKRLGEVKK